jgi:hypothetical protein
VQAALVAIEVAEVPQLAVTGVALMPMNVTAEM